MSATLATTVRQAREALAVCVLLREAVRNRRTEAHERGVLSVTTVSGFTPHEITVERAMASAARDIATALAIAREGGDQVQAARHIRSATAHARLAAARLRPSWLVDADDRPVEGEVMTELAELAAVAAAACDPAASVMAAA